MTAIHAGKGNGITDRRKTQSLVYIKKNLTRNEEWINRPVRHNLIYKSSNANCRCVFLLRKEPSALLFRFTSIHRSAVLATFSVKRKHEIRSRPPCRYGVCIRPLHMARSLGGLRGQGYLVHTRGCKQQSHLQLV